MHLPLARPARRPLRLASLAAALLLGLPGCATNTGTALDKKSTQGAILGGLAGAAAGAAIGGHEHRAAGVLIGAASGALAGGLIGHYLDRQKRELDAIPDASVERREDTLLVVFPGDVLFSQGSSALSAGAHERLRPFAESLVRNPDTNVVIKGHASAEGNESYNLQLSEDRAQSVRSFLVAQGVAAQRLTAVGLGSSFPVASNETSEGRAANRRVEFEIRPNDELRERQRSGAY